MSHLHNPQFQRYLSDAIEQESLSRDLKEALQSAQVKRLPLLRNLLPTIETDGVSQGRLWTRDVETNSPKIVSFVCAKQIAARHIRWDEIFEPHPGKGLPDRQTVYVQIGTILQNQTLAAALHVLKGEDDELRTELHKWPIKTSVRSSAALRKAVDLNASNLNADVAIHSYDKMVHTTPFKHTFRAVQGLYFPEPNFGAPDIGWTWVGRINDPMQGVVTRAVSPARGDIAVTLPSPSALYRVEAALNAEVYEISHDTNPEITLGVTVKVTLKSTIVALKPHLGHLILGKR